MSPFDGQFSRLAGAALYGQWAALAMAVKNQCIELQLLSYTL